MNLVFSLADKGVCVCELTGRKGRVGLVLAG